MTEIFTRINKDKYNVNFTTDNFDKYLFVQEAARSCLDADAPESGETIVSGCGFCVAFGTVKTQYYISNIKGEQSLITVSFCPVCGKKMKGA